MKRKTTKTVKTEELNGVKGMEATVAYLQRAMDALDEAAWYFECLGMNTQSEQLDSAQMKVQDVQDLLGVFLGTVEQIGPFDAAKAKAKARKVAA